MVPSFSAISLDAENISQVAMNEYRQVAVSLRRQFKKREWLDAYNVEGLQAGTLKESAPARGMLRPLFIGRLGRMASGSALTS